MPAEHAMWSAFTYYAALAFEAFFGIFGVRLYEEPKYDVIGRLPDGVEIRRYGPRIAAGVEAPGAGQKASGEAFGLLFAYIAGANRAQGATSGPVAERVAERVAMTVPVEVRGKERVAMTVPVQARQAGGAMEMLFYLPAKFTVKTAPVPTDARVRIVSIPGATIATLRYSGSGSDFAARQSQLAAALKDSPWRMVSAPYVLSYDAPFTLPFLRRNEAAVAVEPAVQK